MTTTLLPGNRTKSRTFKLHPHEKPRHYTQTTQGNGDVIGHVISIVISHLPVCSNVGIICSCEKLRFRGRTKSASLRQNAASLVGMPQFCQNGHNLAKNAAILAKITAKRAFCWKLVYMLAHLCTRVSKIQLQCSLRNFSVTSMHIYHNLPQFLFCIFPKF